MQFKIWTYVWSLFCEGLLYLSCESVKNVHYWRMQKKSVWKIHFEHSISITRHFKRAGPQKICGLLIIHITRLCAQLSHGPVSDARCSTWMGFIPRNGRSTAYPSGLPPWHTHDDAIHLIYSSVNNAPKNPPFPCWFGSFSMQTDYRYCDIASQKMLIL